MYDIKKIMIFVISIVIIAFVCCTKYLPPSLQLILFVIAMAASLVFMIYLLVMKIPISMIITILLSSIGGLSELASKLVNVYIKQDQSIIGFCRIISPVSFILSFLTGIYCVLKYGNKKDKAGGMAEIIALVIVGCIFLYIVS